MGWHCDGLPLLVELPPRRRRQLLCGMTWPPIENMQAASDELQILGSRVSWGYWTGKMRPLVVDGQAVDETKDAGHSGKLPPTAWSAKDGGITLPITNFVSRFTQRPPRNFQHTIKELSHLTNSDTKRVTDYIFWAKCTQKTPPFAPRCAT